MEHRGQEDEVPEALEAAGCAEPIPGRVCWGPVGRWVVGLAEVGDPVRELRSSVRSGVVIYFLTLYIQFVHPPWSVDSRRPGSQKEGPWIPTRRQVIRSPPVIATVTANSGESQGNVLNSSGGRVLDVRARRP